MRLSFITVILNGGANPEEKKVLTETIAKAFEEAKQPVNIITIQTDDDFITICERWVTKAKDEGGVIAAAGGDGTINMIAGLCYRHKVTLGVIPLGTFNYFARDLSIPTDIKQAVEIITNGRIKKISVGLVEEHIFLNNASFGLYTKLIRQREVASSRFGRVRLIAAFAAMYSMLHAPKLFSIRINTDEEKQWHTTSMVFVGNNTLQLENLGMEVAACTRQDKLAVIIMKPASRWEMARFLLRGVVKNLKDEEKLTEFCSDGFEVKTNRTVIDLVIDGEIIQCKTPLEFRVEKNALNVLVPPPEEGAA